MELEIKSPADLQKAWEGMVVELKAKGESVKNLEERVATYENAITELKAAQKAKEDLSEATLLELKSTVEKTVNGFDALQARVKSDMRRNSAAPQNEVKSYTEVVAEVIDSRHDDIEKFQRGELKSLKLELKTVADVSTANVTGTTVWGAQYKPGIITNPNQITHVREFIPTSAAGPGTDFYFMKENGNGEGAPAPVSEKQAADATNVATGLKPSFDLDLVESSVKFETIAGIMIASNKSLKNIPDFQNYLNMRVPQKLLDVEDAQLLYGTGSTPQLKGLLYSGNYTASTATITDPLVEKIIHDISVMEDTYKRVATKIVMRPIDYWSFFLNKAEDSGVYDLPKNVVFVGNKLYIGGVEVIKTTALTSGDYFIEAAMGAELKIQQGLTVEYFNQHASLAATNQVMIRVEETIALPVYGATYRILGTSDES